MYGESRCALARRLRAAPGVARAAKGSGGRPCPGGRPRALFPPAPAGSRPRAAARAWRRARPPRRQLPGCGNGSRPCCDGLARLTQSRRHSRRTVSSLRTGPPWSSSPRRRTRIEPPADDGRITAPSIGRREAPQTKELRDLQEADISPVTIAPLLHRRSHSPPASGLRSSRRGRLGPRYRRAINPACYSQRARRRAHGQGRRLAPSGLRPPECPTRDG